LPGFKEIQPQVFAGLYPTEANQYDSLRDALEKLKLNDSSLHYEPEVSRRWASAFAAASWACCTWRSCRSGWSASSTRT
jgi:translation elongation factor EF-4